jgi:hypothetical protein
MPLDRVALVTMVYVLGGVGQMLAFVTRLASVMVSRDEKDKPPDS